MTPEDIGDIFQALEDALFAMAIRTMKHHENWEDEEGFQWTQWQAEQIQGLRAYRQNVRVLTDYHFMLAKNAIEAYLREAYRNSVGDAAETARQIMTLAGRTAEFSQQFFGVNSQKLDILINEAIQNIDTKRYAAINRMNSGYTDMLRKADMFAQSGSFTIPQVIDMAAKDFLSAGLNCVEYSNGNRVNIASYAEMALRTSSSEVTRQANGDVRNELGEYLVVSNVIGITCPICQKWQGRVLVDNVYSDGKPDGIHPTVSMAKNNGFLHPNCRHQLYMYIPGLTIIADLPDTDITRERYQAEQQQRYQERQIRKYKRLRDGAMDPGNRQKYDARVKEWTQRHNEFLEEHDYLRKNPKRLAPGYTGNGKPEMFDMSRVGKEPSNIEKKTIPRVLKESEKADLLEYASKREIDIYQIDSFDGSPDVLKDEIETICSLKERFPKVFEGDRITIAFDDLGDNTYGRTVNKTIYFNKYYLRDKTITEEILKSDKCFSGCHIECIAKHEFGHLVQNVYGKKGYQIALEAYYNIYDRSISYSDLKTFLKSTVSDYCGRAIEYNEGRRKYAAALAEIIPEILAAENQSDYIDEFLRLLGEEVLK